jgi:hypothetical protein
LAITGDGTGATMALILAGQAWIFFSTVFVGILLALFFICSIPITFHFLFNKQRPLVMETLPVMGIIFTTDSRPFSVYIEIEDSDDMILLGTVIVVALPQTNSNAIIAP